MFMLPRSVVRQRSNPRPSRIERASGTVVAMRLIVERRHLAGRRAGTGTQALQTAAARVAALATGIAWSVMVSRALGPAGWGAYAVLITVVQVAVTVGALSLTSPQTFLWSTGEPPAAIAANSLMLGLLLGAAAAIGAW